ncbi:hypothetical protein SynBOUM118_02022 [Synechococcus sp. BOUM118]|nr:hypothetical protein SynRS9915_02162 [Synechococcus sp. RS9915]QNI92371.1 hypothetical protein SynBOUM118_02022 [Synechococcus sp. BOUM118]
MAPIPNSSQRMEPIQLLHGLFLKPLVVSAKVHLREADGVAEVHTR